MNWTIFLIIIIVDSKFSSLTAMREQYGQKGQVSVNLSANFLPYYFINKVYLEFATTGANNEHYGCHQLI